MNTPLTTARRSLLAGVVAIALALTGTAAVTTPAVAADGEITYVLHKSDNPTADELDAYARITAAMDAAVARYNEHSDITKSLNVFYDTGVPTANGGGDEIRFGADRRYMVESTALHETSHTLGIGVSAGYFDKCSTNQWSGPIATALLESWDGAGARINCGGYHIWPYGLNYDTEMSDLNADRHVELIAAMIADGL